MAQPFLKARLGEQIMNRQKKLTVLAALLCIMLCGLTGCGWFSEQFTIVENHTEKEQEKKDAKKEKSATTEALPEQNVLADFINPDGDTLGTRIIVPNGYTRTGASSDAWATSRVKLASASGDSEGKSEAFSDGKSKSEGESESTLDSEGSVVIQDDEDASSDGYEDQEISSDGYADEDSDSESSISEASSDASESSVSGDASSDAKEPEVGDPPKRTNTGSASGDGTIEWAMRSLPVKPDGAPVLDYTGSRIKDQDSHIAVLHLTMDDGNLQQSASSIMRLYSEFFWSTRDYKDMNYSLATGKTIEYSKWQQGQRLSSAGTWYDAGEKDQGYETLTSFMEYYFLHSGMTELLKDSGRKQLADLTTGDFFVSSDQKNCAFVIDTAENDKGARCFLLATGGSPEHDIEILKNPAHEDPWYYVSELSTSFKTPEFELTTSRLYHFGEKSGTAGSDTSGDADLSSDASSDASGDAEDQ